MAKELKVMFEEGKVYIWKNISIAKFVEDGRNYLRIKTRTPGIRSVARKDLELGK